jgi:hypothetical protein
VQRLIGIFLQLSAVLFLLSGNKLINRDAGLPDSAPEGADGKFFVLEKFRGHNI